MNSPFEFRLIAVSAIDPEDRLFAISPESKQETSRLAGLVKSFGVILPLTIEKKGSGVYRLVTGFKSFLAARHCGLVQLPALVVSGPPQTLFTRAVIEHASVRELSLVEQSEVVRKYLDVFRSSPSWVTQSILPLLGLRPSRRLLDQLVGIARLPEDLRRGLAGNLTAEAALLMKDWTEPERELLLRVVRKLRLGANKQRQIVELVADLRLVLDRNAAAIWESSGARAIGDDESLPPGEAFQRIRNALRRLRLPTLVRYENRLDSLRGALNLPHQVTLRLPPFFEGSHAEVTIRACSPLELSQSAQRVVEACATPEMNEIFEML